MVERITSTEGHDKVISSILIAGISMKFFEPCMFLDAMDAERAWLTRWIDRVA